MKEIKTPYGTYNIIDRPITSEWDMLTAIDGAKKQINGVVKELYGTTKRTQGRYKALENVTAEVIDNLAKLIIDYQHGAAVDQLTPK
jgi:hypothetical protein